MAPRQRSCLTKRRFVSRDHNFFFFELWLRAASCIVRIILYCADRVYTMKTDEILTIACLSVTVIFVSMATLRLLLPPPDESKTNATIRIRNSVMTLLVYGGGVLPLLTARLLSVTRVPLSTVFVCVGAYSIIAPPIIHQGLTNKMLLLDYFFFWSYGVMMCFFGWFMGWHGL
jgi:hypothetical protein